MAFDNLRPVALETAPERIADQIRASILDGNLLPGTQLNEAQLATRLEVSRGPVREAMQRLIQEGLLRAERHRGVFVMELEPDDVHDVYLARRAIEREAARRVLERETSSLVDKLEQLVDAMQAAEDAGDRAAFVEADLRFHEALVAAAQSKRLSRMFRTLIGETRMSIALGLDYGDWTGLAVDHRPIVDALKKGDRSELLDRLEAHLVYTGT